MSKRTARLIIAATWYFVLLLFTGLVVKALGYDPALIRYVLIVSWLLAVLVGMTALFWKEAR